jgi:hypothetical protein
MLLKVRNAGIRFCRPLAIIGLTFAWIVACVGPAQALQLQVNGNAPYLCAAVQGSSTTNGTAVIAYSCSGGFNDQWNFVGGQFQGLGTANGASMCLDVKGAQITAGTLVDLYQCNNGQNQQWLVLAGAGGVTEIFGLQSGLCLDSAGGPSVGGGTQLVINTCSGAASQNWLLSRLQMEVSSNAPYMCMADEGGNTTSGTPVIAYSCSGVFNNEWQFSNHQILGIGTANGKQKCLTAEESVGSVAYLSTCDGGSRQRWEVAGPGLAIQQGDVFNQVLSVAALCLDSAGPSAGGGTQLVVNDCALVGSQNWILR